MRHGISQGPGAGGARDAGAMENLAAPPGQSHRSLVRRRSSARETAVVCRRRADSSAMPGAASQSELSPRGGGTRPVQNMICKQPRFADLELWSCPRIQGLHAGHLVPTQPTPALPPRWSQDLAQPWFAGPRSSAGLGPPRCGPNTPSQRSMVPRGFRLETDLTAGKSAQDAPNLNSDE